jgi:plasmid stability protein
MATLYVENFPDELYAALRKRAKNDAARSLRK